MFFNWRITPSVSSPTEILVGNLSVFFPLLFHGHHPSVVYRWSVSNFISDADPHTSVGKSVGIWSIFCSGINEKKYIKWISNKILKCKISSISLVLINVFPIKNLIDQKISWFLKISSEWFWPNSRNVLIKLEWFNSISRFDPILLTATYNYNKYEVLVVKYKPHGNLELQQLVICATEDYISLPKIFDISAINVKKVFNEKLGCS